MPGRKVTAVQCQEGRFVVVQRRPQRQGFRGLEAESRRACGTPATNAWAAHESIVTAKAEKDHYCYLQRNRLKYLASRI